MAAVTDDLKAILDLVKLLKSSSDGVFVGLEKWVLLWGPKLFPTSFTSIETTLIMLQKTSDAGLSDAETILQSVITLLGAFGVLSMKDLEDVILTHPVLTKP